VQPHVSRSLVKPSHVNPTCTNSTIFFSLHYISEDQLTERAEQLDDVVEFPVFGKRQVKNMIS
jgi:hypothetical protein